MKYYCNPLNINYKYQFVSSPLEGAWVTKHDGKYYLQYAAPGTEYNIYADGVYVSNGVTRLIDCTTRIWFSVKPVSVSAR
jgi:hypothetical protein